MPSPRTQWKGRTHTHKHTLFAKSSYNIICWLSLVQESYTITSTSDSFVFYDLMQNQNPNSIRLKD